MIPTASISDPRLKPRDRAVLGALCSFAPSQSGTFPAERKRIAAVAGIHETHVSSSLSNLIGHGWVTRSGYTNKTRYAINWDLDPGQLVAKSATSSDPQLVAKSATSSPLQLVAKSATSPDRLLVANPATSPSRARDKVSSTKTDKTSNSDSDQTRAGDGFSLGDAIEILMSFGMPIHLAKAKQDRELVASWVSAGVTRDVLRQACQQATDRKRDGKPIGPRYVNAVLVSMREEGTPRAADGCLDSKNYAAGAWGEDV